MTITVIKTRSSKSKEKASQAEGLPSVASQFNSVLYTDEKTALSLVESTGISVHILDLLKGKYDIEPRDNGVALSSIDKWVAHRLPNLDGQDMDALETKDSDLIYALAARLVESIPSGQARSGNLGNKPEFNLNLIGESTHAKALSSC